MQFGLLGRKLSHSYSPQIHSLLADYPYRLIEIEPDDLEHFMNTTTLSGFNVTMPYKKAVIPYCVKLSEQAKKLGAVNTVVRNSDGNWIGHNTDYFGFSRMVALSGVQLEGKKVLVLGSGGASATAVAVLKELGAEVVVVSRTGENNYQNITNHLDAAAIVNTTPVGMYPNTGVTPIDLDVFPALEGVLDVIYNPGRTQLLMDAEKRGIISLNGLYMLVAQAKESAEWFAKKQINDTKIQDVYQILRRQMENIVLVGMPGCGKSTVGRALAEKLGKRFVDTDVQIELSAGKTIPEIFATEGESAFRELEHTVLKELGKESGLVIATGGGCVTQQRNYPALHQNARIIYIQRDIEKLPTDGRPLSEKGKLHTMFLQRKPLYESFADLTIDNNGAMEDTIAAIIGGLI